MAKKNEGEMELIPRVDNSEIKKDVAALSNDILHSVDAVEKALKKRMSEIGDYYDKEMQEIASGYEKAFQEAEQKVAKTAARLQQQAENKFRTELAQKTGIVPKGKNGGYTAGQLKNLQLTENDRKALFVAKDSALTGSGTLTRQQRNLSNARANIESLKELKKVVMTFNTDDIEKIPQILSDIGVKGEKLKETVATLKKLGNAVVSYEKAAQQEIGRIEGTKSKTNSPRTDRGLDQSKANSSPSTRVQNLIESLDKTTADTVNKKVKSLTSALEKSTGKPVSQAKIDEITEIVYEEVIRGIKAQGSKVIPTGRKKPVVEYEEGTPVDKGRGVLTTRSFDAFVANGKLIPSSKYVRDESGTDSREFYKSIGILDKRLVNPNKIGGLGNLFNASITQLQQAYETLESILDNKTLNSDVRKQVEEFQQVIVSAVVDSFANTNEQELKERLSRSIYGADEYNQNTYEQLYEDATFNKRGNFYDALRRQIPNLSLRNEYQEFDPDTVAYEYKESNDGRDNATTIEVLMEEAVKNAVAVAERVKALRELTDYFKTSGLNDIMQGLSSDLSNTSDVEVRSNAIKIAQELIMQALDDMGYKVDYARNSVKTVSMSDFTRTNDEGKEFNLIEETVPDADTPDFLVEEKEALDTLKSQYYGLLEQYKSYIQHVTSKSLPEDKKDGLIKEIDSLIKSFPEDYNEKEGGELLTAISSLSEVETTSSSIVQSLNNLRTVIDTIALNRDREQQEAEEIGNQALSIQEGRRKIKAGESFAEDELYDEADDLYGSGWVKRVKNALSKSEGELDDSAKQLIDNFVNAVYSNAVKTDSEESRVFAKQLMTAFRSSEDSVSLYNILSKMLEESHTVDTSIQRYVDELNQKAGGDYFSFDTELANWKAANPDRARAYERSKMAREAFDKAGGLVNVSKAMETVFNLDDFYIQQLKERFDALNYEVEETIVNTSKNDNGEVVETVEKVTQNIQDTVLKAIAGRLDASGVFENPDKYRGSSYYKVLGQKGESVPENQALSPQQKTSLYYKAGYTGAVYGGRTIGENITNAEKTLAAKQEELAKKRDTLNETQIKILEAQIAVIEEDIQRLKEANARRMNESDLVDATIELIDTSKATPKVKTNKQKSNESVSAAYERAKRLKEAQESKTLTPGYSYKLKNGTTGEILESLGDDKYKVSMVEGSSGAETRKEATVLGKKFIENLYDYIAPAVENASQNVGEQIQQESKKKKDINIEGQEQSQSAIKTDSSHISSDTVYVDSELTNVNTADVALVSKGSATVNLDGKVNLNGDVSVEGKMDVETSPTTGKVTGIHGFRPNFVDKNDQHAYVNPETGQKFLSVTQLRDRLLRGSNPTFEADLNRIKEKARANFEAGLGAISIDDFEGMQPKDFKFMVEDVIGQGIRGDTFHSLIDKFAKSGLKTEEWTLEELAQKDNEAFKKYQDEYNKAIQELAKYGIGEEFLGISERLEGYVNAMKKSGMSPTKFSEQRLAFTMSGTRGDISVGVTPDQLFSMGTSGAFVDNKLGGVKGYEAFQLTGQMLASLANLDTELVDEKGNVIGKVRDFMEGVDFDKPMKAYIADVEEGMTQLKEYLFLSRDEFYNLAMDAQEIAQGRRQPLTKEEQYSRMNRQLKTGRYVGVSSDYMNAEIIEPNQRAQMTEIRNFIQMYRQRLTLEREIAEKEEQIKTANTDQAQQLHEQLAARKRQLQLINEQMPKESHITQTMGEVSMDRTMIGDTMLDYEMAEVLKDLKAREEGRSDIKLTDRMAAVFKKGQAVSNKEQVGLVREYVDAYKDLHDLELKLSKAEGALNLAEMAGVDGEDLQRLRDTVELYRSWRDDQKGRVEEFGLDEKNAKFGFDEGQIKLSKKNAQKLYSDLEDIRRKYTENQTKAMETYSKNVRSQETKLNDQLIKAAKQYYDARRELQKMDLDQTKNPALAEGYAPAKAHWEEKSEEALKNMQDIVRLAEQFDVNLSSGFNNIKDQTAEYRTYTTNMGAKKSAAQGTGVGAQKLIQEYLANLKQQYNIEQQIHALELKMQDQRGAELKNSQTYMTSLQAQLNTVKQMAPVLNIQDRTLNGIQLTEEQITNILRQQSSLYQTHQVQLDKINARQRESRGLLSEIVGGFRQAFKNLTDASVAYEIIGQIKMGITTLIQTTKELDASMSDLRIASGATRDEMHDMMLDFTDLGAELGRTTQDVSQAANDWLRAGYAGEEAAELTKASAQLSTLGMIETADATSYLISVLKGWKIEAAEVARVVDKLTAVDLAAAISAGRDSLNTGRPVDRIKIAS